MLREDESSLICDLAETYGILDYKALPVSLLATLCCGLKENSRIKMKLLGMKAPMETILLASVVDKLSFLVWSKTKDSEEGISPPDSLVRILTGHTNERHILSFATEEEFETAKARAQGRI